MNKFFKKLAITALAGFSLFSFNSASANERAGIKNNYPIILVHGFSGWGRNEMAGVKYWGLFSGDIQEKLKEKGHPTFTAAMGPVSSNYDQAAELYAQIKGGCVDYGEAHSAKHGHERYGRCYDGFYPEWGTVDPDTGKIRKVHLIAHSHGGKTSRMLVQLLEQGSPIEEGNVSVSPLLDKEQSTRNWVASATTISTPHDGTTLTEMFNSMIPYVTQVLNTVGATAGVVSSKELIFDFKLDQWGLKRQEDESMSSYLKRIENSNMWHNNKDFAIWDLSVDGSYEFNGKVKAQPNVYYFSWATKATRKALLGSCELPSIFTGMNPHNFISAKHMGCYSRDEEGHVKVDKRWWPNDGVVNTISMSGPKINSTDEIVPYSGTPQIGKWNYRGLVKNTDHNDVIGFNPLHSSNVYKSGRIVKWYLEIAEDLKRLPN